MEKKGHIELVEYFVGVGIFVFNDNCKPSSVHIPDKNKCGCIFYNGLKIAVKNWKLSNMLK